MNNSSVSPKADDATSRFPSLASLRADHSKLLRRYHEFGNTPEQLNEIEDFIKRGQATGTLLDNYEERWSSQSLLDYWAITCYRAGREPPDATLAKFDPSLAPELDDSLCPYLGLEAFQESNRNLFYGRQNLLAKLIDMLRDSRLLAVVGSSGSGKSSVFLGGLIPIATLARRLQPSDDNDIEWIKKQIEGFQRNPNHLAEIINESGNNPAVLVVDQFEEVFTLCRSDEARQAFINNLIGLIQSPKARHTVIVAMRIDFESQVARVVNFKPLFEQAQVLVTAMDASELREAIEKPAERVGLKFQEGLVEALIQDVLGEPAALPLLQFTLLKLWHNRERNWVTEEAYKRLGGGRQALARSADKFYDALIPEDQIAAKRILLKMVRPTEGLEVTSNRIQRKTLYQTGEARDRVERVLNKLIEARLVRLTEGDILDDDQVEVAHEALVRNWPQLVKWLEEERVTMRQRLRLLAAAEDWAARGKHKSALWRGVLLDEARKYEDLNGLEAEFIKRSIEAEKKQERRELETARKIAQESEARGKAEQQAPQEAEQRAKESKARGKAEQRAELERKARQATQRLNRVVVGSATVLTGLTIFAFYSVA